MRARSPGHEQGAPQRAAQMLAKRHTARAHQPDAELGSRVADAHYPIRRLRTAARLKRWVRRAALMRPACPTDNAATNRQQLSSDARRIEKYTYSRDAAPIAQSLRWPARRKRAVVGRASCRERV